MPTYTVFLSSTFKDFVQERERLADLLAYVGVHVIAAEREGDQGRKLPETLESMIDRSHIVVLLIGSRSGGISETGERWTKKEVDYAFKKGKRVFAYIRELPPDIISFTDRDPRSESDLTLLRRSVDEQIAIVPRYKAGECCKLTAMVVRDVVRCVKEFDDANENDSYNRGFE